ncbi:MAG: hypothetical protein QOH05_4157 [Acetobacteraceae bacterium]|jgi:hypothetical protein|nr:hypothetical protein [Acetobacteraceae bacterium]
MSGKRVGSQAGRDRAFAVPVRPIGDSEFSLVRHAMADVAPEWSVQLLGFCANETTLVVTPEDGDDETGPSFVISRETYGLRLDQVHWDVMTELGVFATLNDILDALRVRLAFCPGLEVPASVRLH